MQLHVRSCTKLNSEQLQHKPNYSNTADILAVILVFIHETKTIFLNTLAINGPLLIFVGATEINMFFFFVFFSLAIMILVICLC